MKTITFIFSLVVALNVSGQNILEAESKAAKATLFLNGAQVHRTAKVNLQKGSNIVKLVGLRQNISGNSIIVEGNSAFTIVSVEFKQNYLRKAEELFEYKDLNAQREKLRWDLRKVQMDKGVLSEESNVLASNQSIKGSNETMNIERLIDYSEMYQDKQIDISIKYNELDKKEKEINTRLNNLNKQLRHLETIHNKSTSEIWLTLNANNSGNTNINFNYYTSEARWQPFYDVRTGDKDDNVNFVLKGKLLQSTGETWDKVNLTLSTGNPSLAANLPQLSPWSIYSRKYIKPKGGKGGYSKKRSLSPAYGEYDITPSEKSMPAAQEVTKEEIMVYDQPLATAKNNLTTIEYTITDPYTLAGDNQYYDVEVITSSTTGKKTFYAAPNYEEKTYAIIEMPEWSKLSLLSGEAAMYYNDNYVGKIYLNTESVEDTLNLSFGPDNNIIMQRKLIHSKERSTVIGNNRIVNRIVEISVRNNKSIPVEIEVDDQLPIAYNKSISVEKIELAGGKYDEKTGYLNWKIKLAPGESKKIQFSYRVKYPKSSTITKF